MNDKDTLKERIRTAFANVVYPGDWCLRGSNEGEEPYLVEEDFKGKTDWRDLPAAFIDQSPNGLATALHFFSDEAFRFYLPAFLIADIDGGRDRTHLLFHLTHGLESFTRNQKVNPRRYGDRTWFDEARYKFSMFTKQEAAAIVAYLKYKANSSEDEPEEIEDALANYWNERGGSNC